MRLTGSKPWPFLLRHGLNALNYTITSTQVITDSETLISPDQVFKLGFFNPPNTTNRYVGIWYNKFPVQTIVWVANRDNPMKDSSGSIGIAKDGNLVISDGRGVVRWTTDISNIATNTNNSVAAELLDTGNLALTLINDDNTKVILWQSFDHPTDTLLPLMKIGGSRLTGKIQQLTSWKDESDPSQGIFSMGLELGDGIPHLVLWSNRRSKFRLWRSGPWNKNNFLFIGIPSMSQMTNDGFNDGFYSTVNDQDDSMYISFKFGDNSAIRSRLVIDHRGVLVMLIWFEGSNEWAQMWSSQENECEVYGKCGPFGRCNPLNSPICSCLTGFKPMFDNEWNKGNWSGGCVRNTQLGYCRNNSTSSYTDDGFFNHGKVKVPDFGSSTRSPTVEDCESTCFWNCSCIAYSYDNGIGCMKWDLDLVDIKDFDETGEDLYIRLARSDLDLAEKNNTDLNPKKYPDYVISNMKLKIIFTYGIAVTVATLAIIICTYFLWRWWAKHKKRMKFASGLNNVDGETPSHNMLRDNPDQLRYFKFEELAIATDDFSKANMLGKGGFGQVYKAKLPDGQELAVKRLSKGSIQGLEEFKNEVVVISKVQHRNLVRLLGCCLQGDEKMLVYEYMPNKSLDAFLFDPTKRQLLDWKKRFQIIEGISRGILYLHRDSRLRVIHRDLKLGNILLDEDLNPKISDFGMARIFGGNEHQASTGRVVGTLGYMPPEYLMEGQFSEKSDVFSFGVLLLEVVSGRKTTNFHHLELSLSLLGFAWKLWNEDQLELFIDPALLQETASVAEILRCIQVGLLCVQELASDRPNMSTTVSLLTSEVATLPTPRKPAFTERMISTTQPDSFPSASANHLTLTDIEGR
ncbi:hypothetical protein MKW92_025142 [Papaver armeniacum]|nr:hypothetical protein MKW92_025142 [Papaver armeniacum]